MSQARDKTPEERYLDLKPWIKDADIFSLSLLMIPIISGQHTTMAVVADPGHMMHPQDGAATPSVVFLDSMHGPARSRADGLQLGQRMTEFLSSVYVGTGRAASVPNDFQLQVQVPPIPQQPPNDSSNCAWFMIECADRLLQAADAPHGAHGWSAKLPDFFTADVFTPAEAIANRAKYCAYLREESDRWRRDGRPGAGSTGEGVPVQLVSGCPMDVFIEDGRIESTSPTGFITAISRHGYRPVQARAYFEVHCLGQVQNLRVGIMTDACRSIAERCNFQLGQDVHSMATDGSQCWSNKEAVDTEHRVGFPSTDARIGAVVEFIDRRGKPQFRLTCSHDGRQTAEVTSPDGWNPDDGAALDRNKPVFAAASWKGCGSVRFITQQSEGPGFQHARPRGATPLAELFPVRSSRPVPRCAHNPPPPPR